MSANEPETITSKSILLYFILFDYVDPTNVRNVHPDTNLNISLMS